MKQKIIFVAPLILLIIITACFKFIFEPLKSFKSIPASARVVKEKTIDTAKIYTTAATVSKAAVSCSPAAIKEQNIKDGSKLLTIVAVGDILLGRGVGMRLDKGNKGYIYPFEKVSNLLKEGDVVFGNLEESITSSTHRLTGIDKPGGKYVLKNEVKSFEGIKCAGFNLLNIANNHILDYYDRGLYDTLDLLDKNGIVHAGAGRNLSEARKPAIIEKKNMKVGMLAYTDMSGVVYKGNPPLKFQAEINRFGVAPRNYEYIRQDIESTRKSVDILIVSLHWGNEESFYISPEQIELAHKLIDQGADIILGHHPHQFQGMEVYKGKPIVYSMGNFIFDQNDPENQESFILNMQFSGKSLKSFSAAPIRTIEKTQVMPVAGQNAYALLKREEELCKKLNPKCSIKEDKIVFDLN